MQVNCYVEESHRGDGYEVPDLVIRQLRFMKTKGIDHRHDAYPDTLLTLVSRPELGKENGWVSKGWTDEQVHHAAIFVLENDCGISQEQILELAPQALDRVLLQQAA